MSAFGSFTACRDPFAGATRVQPTALAPTNLKEQRNPPPGETFQARCGRCVYFAKLTPPAPLPDPRARVALCSWCRLAALPTCRRHHSPPLDFGPNGAAPCSGTRFDGDQLNNVRFECSRTFPMMKALSGTRSGHMYQATWHQSTYQFADLKTLMAKATPLRSGDVLAGVAAASAEENVAATMALGRRAAEAVPRRGSDPLRDRRGHPPDRRPARRRSAFAPVSHLTVGDFRNWLLSDDGDDRDAGRARARPHAGDGRRGLQAHAQPGSDPGRAQVPRRHALPQHDRPAGRLAVRLQPNHPTDDPRASPPRSSTVCCTAAAMP